MRRFIYRLLSMCILLMLVLAGAYFVPDVATRNNILYAYGDKYEVLQQTVSKKTILVGGSNVYFSTSACQLQDSRSGFVYNLGTHAGVGLKYMLYVAERCSRPGDAVVVIPEYEQFSAKRPGYYGEMELVVVLLGVGMPWMGYDIRHVPGLVGDAMVYLSGKLVALAFYYSGIKDYASNNEYNRWAMNECGDILADRISGVKSVPVRRTVFEVDRHSILDMEKALKRIQSKGVNVVVLPPPMEEKNYQINERVIPDTWSAIRSTDLPVFGIPGEFVYPDTLFYGTKYHMNSEGRSIHTTRVAEYIDKAILKNASASGQKLD